MTEGKERKGFKAYTKYKASVTQIQLTSVSFINSKNIPENPVVVFKHTGRLGDLLKNLAILHEIIAENHKNACPINDN